MRQSDTMHLLHQRILVSAPVVSGLSFDWHNTSDEEKARGLVEVQQFITACRGKSVLVYIIGQGSGKHDVYFLVCMNTTMTGDP